MQINLTNQILQILKNSPESAIALYDALLFMGTPDAALSPEYDESLEILYARTEDSRNHRKLYEESRAA